MKWLLVLFLFSLDARIEDYYRKIGERMETEHRMPGVDFIYLINLDRRSDRLQKSCALLAPYGIHPFRVSAVEGWALSSKAFKELGIVLQKGMNKGMSGKKYEKRKHKFSEKTTISKVGETYYSAEGISKGAIGCMLSHLSILQDAYDSGYQTIWVLEDDIEVLKDPRCLSQMIQDLDSLAGGWDILYTDRFHCGKEETLHWHRAPSSPLQIRDYEKSWLQQGELIGTSFYRVNARGGTASMIIRRSGMKKILDFAKREKCFYPIDVAIWLCDDMRLYVTAENIVTSAEIVKELSDVLRDHRSSKEKRRTRKLKCA